MPQGQERTPAERAEFKHMLEDVNLLYLGCAVLVLLDLSYISRFWTQFEAWLSMQQVTPEGLQPAEPSERRCRVAPIYGANSSMVESLYAMWAHRSPQEAHDVLREPDVTVTNQGDKETQLEKLVQLDDEVRQVMAGHAAPTRPAGASSGSSHDPARTAGAHDGPKTETECSVVASSTRQHQPTWQTHRGNIKGWARLSELTERDDVELNSLRAPL